MNPRLIFFGLATVALAGFTSTAHADDSSPASASAGELAQSRTAMWRVEVGYRGSFVTHPGYNAFSTQDYFSQMSVLASRTIFVWGRYSFAPGIAWDYGSAGATDRGTDTSSLSVHRLSIPLEGRAHLSDWAYGFLRVAPGVALEQAELDDASAPGAFTKARWLFSSDVSAGFAVRPHLERPNAPMHPWLQADIGYGWIAAQRLNLAEDAPTPAAMVDLGTLAMQGAFFRVVVAASM